MKGEEMSGEVKPSRKKCCGTCKHWRRIEGRRGRCLFEDNSQDETDIDHLCSDYKSNSKVSVRYDIPGQYF